MKKKIELKNMFLSPSDIDPSKSFSVAPIPMSDDAVLCTVTYETDIPEPVLTITPKQLEKMLHDAGYTMFDSNKALYKFFPDYNGES